ncbi:hypothetical protein OIU79_019557 [Salix purpurea]|uniref:Uncharacterized protein n=1 Tax=Salix purpurea TaxID=77065 RepID=A0A9Q0P1Y2_SALPP|nr:hypothetical protein OIU79_019557 [Salix purpurea]
MAPEADDEPSFTPPRLLLIPKPHAYGPRQSPERSGTLTPPLHSSASVPFRSCSPERGQLGTVVLSKRRVKERGGFLGSWSRGRKDLKNDNRDAGGGSYVFPSSGDREAADQSSNEEEEMISSSDKVKMTRMRRSGSLAAVSNARSQFWASIYEGLKTVVGWRSKKLKKDHGFVKCRMDMPN